MGVFVSYTQADRAWAEWVAWCLRDAGYRVLVQAWHMVAGTNWPERVAAGMGRAARVVAVLSCGAPRGWTVMRWE